MGYPYPKFCLCAFFVAQDSFHAARQDLRPFPTHIAVAYEGHSGMVRAVAVEAVRGFGTFIYIGPKLWV